MNLCRVCLISNPEKDIGDLETYKKGKETTYSHVMMFCLDIQVADKEMSRKLCKKCLNKLLKYYEFKTLALQSEAYLKSLPTKGYVKLEVVDCNLNFDNNDNSQDAKFEIIDVKEEKCKLIIKDYSSNDILKLNHSPPIIRDVETNALAEKQFQRTKTKRLKLTSQTCQRCIKTVKNIKEHMEHHHSPSGLTINCDVCGKVFSTKHALMKHHKLDHNIDISESCSVCNKVVKNLKIHMKIAHNKSSLHHLCPSCDKRFISRSVLKSHMMIHLIDRPFECELCAGKFKQKILLAEHIRQVHNKERPHLCQFCSKSFYKGHHLKVHIRTHTKEKPYKCDECERSFRCIPALNKHKMIHSDAKNYACTLCNKTFARNCYLTHHMLSHTKEKRHACKYCGAMFGRSDNRKRHEYITHERHLSNDHLMIASS